jgi:protein gp37
MGRDSSIEWTHHTFNPWIGCAKVSEACRNCYAWQQMDVRWGRVKWGVNGSRKVTSDAYWRQPLQWDREADAAGERRRVFCASLADVFEGWQGGMFDTAGRRLFRRSNAGGEYWAGFREPLSESDRRRVGDAAVSMADVRRRLFDVIDRTPHLDWLLLTKRPENIERMVPDAWAIDGAPANVWLGFSAETQKDLEARWEWMEPAARHLRPAVVFISAEPLLEFLDLGQCLYPVNIGDEDQDVWTATVGAVFAGGESGPNARPTHPDAVRDLRNQCYEASVPFLFKQWGEWLPYEISAQPSFWHSAADGSEIDGHAFPDGITENEPVEGWYWPWPEHMVCFHRVGKHAAGRLLDGQLYDEVPRATRAELNADKTQDGTPPATV